MDNNELLRALAAAANAAATIAAPGRRVPPGEEDVESDPEDPKYLVRLSRPFSLKMQLQKRIIWVLQNILRMKQVAEKAREAEMKLLQEQVKRLQGTVAQLQLKQKGNEQENINDRNVETVRRIPEAVFMEELWLLIFDKLENPLDMLNVYNTCDFFRSILSGNRKNWMFALALPCILDKLDKEDILKSRMVCKRWRSEVDNCMLYYNCPRPYNSNLKPGRTCMKELSPLKNMMERKGLLKIINPIRKVPNYILNYLVDRYDGPLTQIPGKSVQFHDKHQGDPVVFWKRVAKFLRKWGKEIWSVAFVSDISPPFSDASYFDFISRQLTRLPNLRHLEVVGNVAAVEGPDLDLGRLPDLPHLKSLAVGFTTNDLKMDQALISKYGDQLGKLETTKWNETCSQMEMPNLTELGVWLETWGGGLVLDLDKYEGAKILRDLRNISCRATIQKLSLGPIAFEKCVQQLFELLHEFPNLEVLQLWFGQTNRRLQTQEMLSNMQKLPPEMITPPRLHTLEVTQSFKQLDYIFLAWFPFLQYLHIRHQDVNILNIFETNSEAEKFPEIVQVHRYLYNGRMYESNIWTMLPSLRLMTFLWPSKPGIIQPEPERFYRYEREVYEARAQGGAMRAE